MYKSDPVKIKKSKRQLLAVSIVAVVFMLAMNTNIWNANASIFENIQNVDDVGQSLECVIVVVGCDGTGSVGSSGDVIIGSGDNDTSTTPSDADCEAGIACFVNTLNPTQLGNLKFVLGLPVDAPNELLCDVIDDLTAAELRAAITAPVVGVTDAVATVIINCLIDAGFTNLE